VKTTNAQAAAIMGHRHEQLELFPPSDDATPGSPHGWGWPARRTITPGDWLSIEHDGKTVVGMIYRRQDENYTFVYWDDLVLRFGTTTRDHIGPWNEELTTQFRGQIAVIPNYLEKCIADWVMQPDRPEKFSAVNRSFRPTKVQLLLFPE
jgi:hypothetical protein